MLFLFSTCAQCEVSFLYIILTNGTLSYISFISTSSQGSYIFFNCSTSMPECCFSASSTRSLEHLSLSSPSISLEYKFSSEIILYRIISEVVLVLLQIWEARCLQLSIIVSHAQNLNINKALGRLPCFSLPVLCEICYCSNKTLENSVLYSHCTSYLALLDLLVNVIDTIIIWYNYVINQIWIVTLVKMSIYLYNG